VHLVRLGIDTGCDGGREAVVLLTLWHCLEIFCKFGSWMLCAIYDVRRRHKSASNSGSSLYISWLVWQVWLWYVMGVTVMCGRCNFGVWLVWLWCVTGVTLVYDRCDFGVWHVWLWQVWLFCVTGVTLVYDRCDFGVWHVWLWQVWLFCVTGVTLMYDGCD